MDRICPACIQWREPLSSATSRFGEKPILTNLNRSRILRSGDASPGALILLEKPVRSQPGRIRWQLKMLLQTNLIAGSPRQRLILERLEPCEGKLSRTVLRGPERATASGLPGATSHTTQTNKQHRHENQHQKKHKHRNDHRSFCDSDGDITKGGHAAHRVHCTAHGGLWTRLAFKEAEYCEP